MTKFKLYKWLVSRIGPLVGGLCLGFSFPVGSYVFSPAADFIFFAPLGIIVLAISYYYTFVNTDWE